MPYIEGWRRDEIDEGCPPASTGELTYLITQVVRRYLGKHPQFQNFTEVIGCLEATKLELYRRQIAPYEQQKMRENGEVYF